MTKVIDNKEDVANLLKYNEKKALQTGKVALINYPTLLQN